ncbi:MFS transporter [Trueperella pyogenes]|uniref:MFS transporter n=1 Tax=Trueperella pyogenes TaxID=1661 RepID=UPI00267D7C40
MSSLRSSFGGYRHLPRLVGYPHLIVSFLGRLPIPMVIIGVLTLVVAETGSVAIAAYCSASLAIANGIGNVVIGRLTDQYGQRKPLLAFAPLNVISMVCLLAVAPNNPPTWQLMFISAAIGMTTSPIGSLSRVRWFPIASPRQLLAAMSWETVNDELIFVLGPAAVGILAATVSPGAPIVVAAGLVATCVIPFALSRHARGPADDGRGVPIATVFRRVRAPFTAMLFMGMFFGAMQTTVTAFAESNGMPGLGGLIYSALGLSAAITALGAVAIPERLSFSTQIVAAGVGITLFASSCGLASSGWALVGLLFVTGLFIGPTGVAIFTLAGRLAPRGGDGLANTVMVSANVLGVASASAVVGRFLETNVSFGFLAAGICGMGMALAAALLGRRDERLIA